MRQILYLDNTTIIELMPTRWAGILVVKATRLYVSTQALSESANNPDPSIIRDTDTVYTIMERFERSEFTKFYRQYIADELVWYRGFASYCQIWCPSDHHAAVSCWFIGLMPLTKSTPWMTSAR